MFAVTGGAYKRLSKMLSDRPDDIAVRIVIRGGRMRLRPGTAGPGDEVFEHEGRAVLLFDEKVAKRLDTRSLDIRETEDGPRLRLRRATGHK